MPMLHRFRRVRGFESGFTLIELLTVMAVIGILATIVMVFISGARTRGQVAAAQSTLRSAVTQAELYYSANNNTYAGLCGDAQMQSILIGLGTRAACYDGASFTTIAHLDWGMAKIVNDSNFVMAGPQGVVVVDTSNTGSNGSFATAVSACASAGKKLPSVLQLKALYDADGSLPPTFATGAYWSSIENPSSPSNQAYRMNMSTGLPEISLKSAANQVRCAR